MTAAPDLHSFADIHAHSARGQQVLTSVEPADERTGLPGEAWYSVGIHPWSTSSEPAEQSIALLREAMADPRVIAVGECGLDRRRGGPAQVQEAVFKLHVELSEQYCKPLIVHCVGRYGRLMELHRELSPRQLWIVHGFTGKPELARQLVAEGLAISLGPRSPEGLEAIVPPERRFRESDI
ncbi:MAG: TatD family hydrolase [Muribaculaceae bacterium]|nr:TatD family hydrolase [Muribaculaceae bacterium]